MDSWMIGSMLGLLGLIAVSYLLYAVLAPRGADRRDTGLAERRRENRGPPEGITERRKGPRHIERQ